MDNPILNFFLSKEEGSASQRFLFTASLWVVFGTAFGLLSGIYFVWPDFIKNVPWLQFGRSRPIHVNGVLFAWLSSAYIGIILYIVPKLCKRPIFSERLANFCFWAWNIALLLGLITIGMGITEGREYAEFIAPLDWAVLLVIILMAINVFGTIINRKEQSIYVSLWYFMGTFFWLPFVWLIGNRTFLALPGISDAIANWFYGHNIIGLWFTTVGVGISYYFIPILAQKPLFSHFLSLIGFFSIAIFYAPTGTHHILQSPVPNWLKTIAILSSSFLLVPVLTVLVNFFETMRGAWHKVAYNIPLKFVATGNIFYLFTCIQGPFQATRWANWYLHFSQWVVGHAHLALLGTFSFMAWGAFYYIYPRVAKREWFSSNLQHWHYWLTLVGFVLMLPSLTIAGLVQAAGNWMGLPVQQWHMTMKPSMVFRMISGILIVIGQLLFMYNVIRTTRSGKPITS